METKVYIDINCDLGEGFEHDLELLSHISSCSIACGGHAGDDHSMRQTIGMAKQQGVLVGAHPSYPDKEHFGRRSLQMTPEAFLESIDRQMNSFTRILGELEVPLNHIKPHGALYNDLKSDTELVALFLEAVGNFKDQAALYAAPGSMLSTLALKEGFNVIIEAFADRNYNADLGLVSRSLPDAIINAPESVYDHLIRMVLDRKVKTIDGQLLEMNAQTYCVHGDTPNALQILMYLTKNLPNQNIYH